MGGPLLYLCRVSVLFFVLICNLSFATCNKVIGTPWKADAFLNYEEWKSDFEKRFRLSTSDLVYPEAADGGDTAERLWQILMVKATILIPFKAAEEAAKAAGESEASVKALTHFSDAFFQDVLGISVIEFSRLEKDSSSRNELILLLSKLRGFFDDSRAASNLEFMKHKMSSIRSAVSAGAIDKIDPADLERVK
jgi:hypothetical protein